MAAAGAADALVPGHSMGGFVAVVAAARQRLPGLTGTLVPDVNHYTILMTDRGAAAVSGVVRRRLAEDRAAGDDP